MLETVGVKGGEQQGHHRLNECRQSETKRLIYIIGSRRAWILIETDPRDLINFSRKNFGLPIFKPKSRILSQFGRLDFSCLLSISQLQHILRRHVLQICSPNRHGPRPGQLLKELSRIVPTFPQLPPKPVAVPERAVRFPCSAVPSAAAGQLPRSPNGRKATAPPLRIPLFGRGPSPARSDPSPTVLLFVWPSPFPPNLNLATICRGLPLSAPIRGSPPPRCCPQCPYSDGCEGPAH